MIERLPSSGRPWRMSIACALAALAVAITPAGALAQTRPAGEAEHLAPLQRPSAEHVANSPYGRLVVTRLATAWRGAAEPACIARRKLDDAAFEAGARDVLVEVVGRLRAHHDAAIGDGALAAFRKRAGTDTQAKLAELVTDETVDRFLGMLADRDAGELARDAVEQIARTLLIAGFITDEGAAALGLGDDAVHQTMLRLNTAIDDFLEANKTEEMSALRQLQEAARSAIDGAMDQSRLLAFDSASLAPAVTGPLAGLCLVPRP